MEESLNPLNQLKAMELEPEKTIRYTIDLTRGYHNLLEKEENQRSQIYLWDGNAAGFYDEGAENPQYYLQDELGSPLRIEGEDGGLRESYGYDEFGCDLYQNQGRLQPFGYTGYQHDRVAGTYFTQAREYRTETGQFLSRDKNRYIKRVNTKTINLYSYCGLNPVKYIDPKGLDLEDHYSPQAKRNDPVQVRVNENTITIDAYVDITGDIEIGNSTAHDLAMEGIENWGGNYDNVFGHSINVVVNVHEGHKPWYWWLPWVSNQNYVRINLQNEAGIARTVFGKKGWNRRSPGHIEMFSQSLANGEARADMLGDNDVMVNNHLEGASVSNIDIQMLLLAAETGEWQYYMEYFGSVQSLGVQTYGMCEDD